MSTEKKKRAFQVIANSFRSLYFRLLRTRRLLNNKMKDKFSSHGIALVATLGVVLIWVLMLMITPAKGLADDGSLGNTLTKAGLTYIQKDTEEIYNNYFIRTYAYDSSKQQKIQNAHDVIIRAAVYIDEVFTGDSYFDIRFLAFTYGIFYFIAIYRLIRSICRGIYYFSESMVIALLSVVILGDISYLVYFNSFYPEPMWLIGFIFLVGAICELQYNRRSYSNLLIIGVSTIMLCMTRWQSGIIGFFVAAFFLRAVFINKGLTWRAICVTLSFMMSMIGIISVNILDSDFTTTSKFHSMTKGVLFQASNPEDALLELGINPSYSVLANSSAYNYYPFVLPDSKQLQEGFMDQYDALDIGVYYLKHPTTLFRMLDISVKETMYLRRDFSGNFEISAGMPKMGQSIMWSFWSFFKLSSMPKTIGYLILLIIFALILFGRISRHNKIRKGRYPEIMLSLVFLIIGIGISQALVCIIMSGYSEFGRRAFLMGLAMDMLFYLFICHILPKIKIIEDEGATT